MTRKHYVALADALHSAKPEVASNTADMDSQWRIDCAAVADLLAQDNPRFDRARFLNACEHGTR